MDRVNWAGHRVILPFMVRGGYEAKMFRLDYCYFEGPDLRAPFYYYIPFPEDRQETLAILADIIHHRGYKPHEIMKELHEREQQ